MDRYLKLAEASLLNTILRDAISITKPLHRPGDLFKVKSEPARPLLRHESYIAYCGFCASHFLSLIQKLEHIRVFIDDGTITRRMKSQGINGYHTLLYNVENFIIRSQGLLERTLIFTDAVLDLGNDTQFITYNLIVNNGHVKHIRLHAPLKRLRKITEEHHQDRNEIVHHQEYMEDDLRRLEAYHIHYEASIRDMIPRKKAPILKAIKTATERKARIKWKKEADKFLEASYPVIEEVLSILAPVYVRAKEQFTPKTS